MNGNFGVLAMNIENSFVRIPIKDYNGLISLTIVKSNVKSPMQSNKEIDQSAARIRLEPMIMYCIIS